MVTDGHSEEWERMGGWGGGREVFSEILQVQLLLEESVKKKNRVVVKQGIRVV